MIASEAKLMVPEIKMVTRKIVTTQRIVLLRSFFVEDWSDFDTGLIPLLNKMKTAADRINLTA